MSALAEKKFIIELEGTQYNYTLSLCDSGASPYGNKHSLKLTCTNKECRTESFDARYDARFNTIESFNKYAIEFIKEWADESAIITEVN